jgi:hypothetical protein
MATTSLEREQNRKRQALKRRRDCVERIETQAKTMTQDWPIVWQNEFVEQVRRRQAAAAKACAQVEKTATQMPEGPARDAYVKANYRNTKVSLARERDQFLKRKKKTSLVGIAALTDAYGGYGPDHPDDDRVDSVEGVDWEDPHEVASVLGEDDGTAWAHPSEMVQGSILLGGRGAEGREGFEAAVYLLREMHALPRANLQASEDDNDIGAPQLATPEYSY